MKATIKETGKSITTSHRKEAKFYKQVTVYAIEKNTIKEIIACRFYQTQARVYCCLWIYGNNIYTAGSDHTTGGGYHLESAAAQGAINNAGISLSESINGRGNEPIESALLSIGAAMGFKHVSVQTAHG